MELHLVSDIPPSVNHYLGHRAIMKKGKPLSVTYVTQPAAKYKKDFIEYVKQEVESQNWIYSDNKYQHFYFDAVFYFDKICKDTNNYFKVMLDAITDTKCVWVDDNVVCERVQRIYYDSQNPRIEICVHPVEYVGLFDTESQLDKFVSNCVGCSRYARNCSILKNAKIGRVQEHIVDGECVKYKEKKS